MRIPITSITFAVLGRPIAVKKVIRGRITSITSITFVVWRDQCERGERVHPACSDLQIAILAHATHELLDVGVFPRFAQQLGDLFRSHRALLLAEESKDRLPFITGLHLRGLPEQNPLCSSRVPPDGQRIVVLNIATADM